MATIKSDEARAEFEAIRAEWRRLYAPRDTREKRFVDQLIANDWFLQRATQRLMEAEANGDWARIPTIQKYKDSVEKRFIALIKRLKGCEKKPAECRRRGLDWQRIGPDPTEVS